MHGFLHVQYCMSFGSKVCWLPLKMIALIVRHAAADTLRGRQDFGLFCLDCKQHVVCFVDKGYQRFCSPVRLW